MLNRHARAQAMHIIMMQSDSQQLLLIAMPHLFNSHTNKETKSAASGYCVNQKMLTFVILTSIVMVLSHAQPPFPPPPPLTESFQTKVLLIIY